MLNAFGTATSQVALVDPRDARRYRQRFRRDAVRELACANSLYVPLGERPARGWILLPRSDYDSIRGYGTSYQLNLGIPGLSFGNLSIVQAQSVTTGLLGDQDAIYLVELTDARGVLANQFFQYPTNSYYNVLSPAYPGRYYASSMSGGITNWTWATMIGDLWNQLTFFLGAFPGLPIVPSGTPTNWNLPGVSAWRALNAMLTHIGLGISCDLTSATPYGIVSLGAADASFDNLTAKYVNRLEDDLDWIDLGSGRVPGNVIVYFRRINQYYGTEETIRRDNLQWATNSVYSVNVSAPAFFVGAVGTHYIQDDFPVRYDIDGNPLAADVATAAAIATERVSQYFDDIYSRTSGSMNRTYTGVLPFYAGSQVDGVCWRQDFQDQQREGWRTQVIRGDLWPEIYG
jgi:hypothetical protein